ncbi:hypothetical protein [Evansella clarkii]|jgi:hypothetical protein|uniref:hypothetical protein n=1 Tax=Evansella clarkii TaxID=79879 RepID=UPI00142F40DB|nr:hypothetical protein [Evansella clarkii]
MNENSPKDIELIERRAREEDREAKRADIVVEEAISHMNPQRQYSAEKSLDKR